MRLYYLMVLALVIGCDSDRFLSGQWTTVAPLSDLVSDYDLNIELNLGHFGSDVVGVARFIATSEFQFDALGCDELPSGLPPCKCNRLDGMYKASTETFYVTIRDCDGTQRDLRLNEGGVGLTGTISTIKGERIAIEFEQTKSERQLTSSDRTCDKCPDLQQ